MKGNSNLHAAKKAKNDEFYTQYEDIEKELIHYKDQLKGLSVLCPCDTEESNFTKFFADHFDEYQLNSLTATHYNPDGQSYRLDFNNLNKTWIKTPLEGNGDFRSEEIKKIAKEEADIIITNPPFSLFRDFIKFLEEVE